MDPFELRAARMKDAAHCATLVTMLGYPTQPDQMERRLAAILAAERSVTLVAEHADGGVLGLAGASLGWYYEKDGTYARLNVLVVAEGLRGAGIGRALVQAIEAWAVSHDAGDIVVNSASHREAAHGFYAALGYRITGVRLVKALTG
jgi:GNAT superfamily N-acetyltransferase